VPKKIAISGKMASGKTTAANILRDKYGYKVCSVAAPIKEIASIATDEKKVAEVIMRLCNWNVARAQKCKEAFKNMYPKYEGHDLTFKDNKTRSFLQELGRTFREIDPDVWIRDLIQRSRSENLVVIDDLRYRNELRLLKEAGFITIRLNITEDIQKERLKNLYGHVDNDKINDSSETDLDNSEFDYVINNTEDIQTLIKQLDVVWYDTSLL
jgi:dephospho-CoA kinase